MPEKHSIFSPSGAHRWLNCPGSLHLEGSIKLPEYIGSEVPKRTYAHFNEELKYADEGNIKHNEAAKLLIDKSNKLSDDDGINDYLQYCRRLITTSDNPYSKAFVETEVGFENLAEDGFGTIDFFIIDGPTLEIVDFKYGRRRVPAFENPQLMLYAWGVLETFPGYADKVREIKLTICQPRALDLEPAIDSWNVSRKELIEFGNMVKKCGG